LINFVANICALCYNILMCTIKCPNPKCKTNLTSNSSRKNFIKKGYYKTKHNHQPVPRYKCNVCGANFSSHTFRETYNHKKPYINESAFGLFSSSVTIRRAMKLLKVAKKTVERKFQFAAKLAERKHKEELAKIKTSYVQFDEMETCEATKCKPLSIALAVRPKTGFIIDAQVAKMKCKGKLKNLLSISQLKYNWNVDNRGAKCKKVLETIKSVSKDHLTIASDSKKAYISLIKNNLPNAIHTRYLSRKSKNKKERDPLFKLNHVCAKIRADLSRMRRRTWAITKKWENLQKHLYIYIAWCNHYHLDLNHC